MLEKFCKGLGDGAELIEVEQDANDDHECTTDFGNDARIAREPACRADEQRQADERNAEADDVARDERDGHRGVRGCEQADVGDDGTDARRPSCGKANTDEERGEIARAFEANRPLFLFHQ